MSLVLITPPSGEPVSLDEAKAQLRVESDNYKDDDSIAFFIAAARTRVEALTGRALVNQTWDLYADAVPRRGGALELAKGTVQSVASVKYIDTDGVQQTLDPAKYVVDTARIPGRILPAYGEEWPATREQVNAVVVRFVAGYGIPYDVPHDLKQAIRLLASHWFENREMVVASNIIISPIPETLQAIISPYRLEW